MVLELLDAGEDVLVLDNLSTGFRWAVPAEAKFVEGDVGDHNLVRRLLLAQQDRRHHPFRRVDRGAEVDRRSARLLSQQHLQVALAAGRCRSRPRSRISSSRRPRRSTACRRTVRSPRTCAARADLALWQLEADDRDDAARHGGGASAPLCGAALFQRRRRRSEGPERAVDAARHASHQGRVASRAGRAALSRSVRHRLSDARRHLRPRLYPRERSRPRPSRCAALSPRRRQERGAELRLRQPASRCST